MGGLKKMLIGSIVLKTAVLAWCFCLAFIVTPAHSREIPVSVHSLNISLVGATTGWPVSNSGLEPLNETVTSTFCSLLPTVSSCSGFLVVETSGSSLTVQLEVEASTQNQSFVAYQTFTEWSNNQNLPLTELQSGCQSVLGATLSILVFSSAVYTVPCRGAGVFSFLPSCASQEIPQTTVFVSNNGAGAIDSIRNFLCPQGSCPFTILSSTVDGIMNITILEAARGLEAVLNYLTQLRQFGTSNVPDNVWMASGSMNATLFSVNESVRYTVDYPVSIQCPPETGYWAFALITVLPFGIILFWCLWYRGRRRGKKRAKALLIEDETRIMQGYANPAPPTTTGDNAAPETEEAADTSPWVMDEYGNYYSTEAPANDETRVTEPHYEYWVDPTTGQTYQFLAEEPTGETEEQGATDAQGTAAEEGQEYQNMTQETYGGAEVGEDDGGAAADDGGGGAVENYYVADDGYAPQDYENQGDSGETGYYQDPDSGITYQVYVDPASGETYYQPLDNEEG